MQGLIGKKVGMTSIFNEDGKNIPCTVIKAGPCVVTQIKTEETDGYNSFQLGFDDKKEKNTTKAMMGHFKKTGNAPLRKLVEFSGFESSNYKLGDVLTVDLFKEDNWLDVRGFTKGKGFQGVVKRHGFHGVGDATHGQHNRDRAPGSLGGSSSPSRVFKGMRMAGRTGGNQVMAISLSVVKLIPEENLLLLKGSVPGPNGSYLIITK